MVKGGLKKMMYVLMILLFPVMVILEATRKM